MGKKLGIVFNVSRVNKTKRVNVGDFDTFSLAKKAMLEHFKSTSKRGKFYYCILEDELEEFEGIVMRSHAISLSGQGNYYRNYSRQELEVMCLTDMTDEKTKTYYILHLDDYGQPDGTVETWYLTAADAERLSKSGHFVFDKYIDALRRAQD